ncbi:hypothetical protein TL16_g07066 [Triparma laevis f. inornata]|uniref:Uncharacterized protein n=2 Tax=Triparma laevis TaxID=1534972 RepID=A0A9W7DMY3_9STRA|nr:hypothetical protein TrLO_g867 [Triparma laevis f. longispina]GMH76401.1 hypothetical protein TL16_g07066 [Triparma laevis f. inornata]
MQDIQEQEDAYNSSISSLSPPYHTNSPSLDNDSSNKSKPHRKKHSRGSSLDSLASISSSIISHLISPNFLSFTSSNDTKKKQRILPIPSPPNNYPPQQLDVYFNQMKTLGSIGNDLDCLGIQCDATNATEHSDSTGSEGITDMWRNA